MVKIADNKIHIDGPEAVYVFQDIHDMQDWIRDGAHHTTIHDYVYPALNQRAKEGTYHYTHGYGGPQCTVYSHHYWTPQTHHKVPFPFTAWAVVKHHK